MFFEVLCFTFYLSFLTSINKHIQVMGRGVCIHMYKIFRVTMLSFSDVNEHAKQEYEK